MRPLRDGEKRMLPVNGQLTVQAVRVDCDTPYIHLVVVGQKSITLTDVDAQTLVHALQRALAVLTNE